MKKTLILFAFGLIAN